MMGDKATYLRVGLLVVAGIAAAIGLVLFLSRDMVRNGLEFETYSKESVQGLVNGAPVKFRGVTLGEVTQIGLVSAEYPEAMPAERDPTSYELVVIRFTVDPKKLGRVLDIELAVQLGLRARLATAGLTGVAYLELDFVDPKKFPAEKVPWTPRVDFIPAIPSTIEQVQDAAEALLSKLDSVDVVRLTGSAQRLLDDLHEQLTAGDVHGTLAEAHLLLSTLRVAVQNTDLPGLAADLKQTTDSVRGLVQGKQVKQFTNSAADAAKSVADAARQLQPLLLSLEATVKHTDDSVGDLQEQVGPALRDVRAAAANLRDTSETLRRYPSSVIFGSPPPREQP
jgi:ABC-type transporter Mla subunit MlaD